MLLVLLVLAVAVVVPAVLIYLVQNGHGPLLTVLGQEIGYYRRRLSRTIKRGAVDPMMRQFGWIVVVALALGTVVAMVYAKNAHAGSAFIGIGVTGLLAIAAMVRVLVRSQRDFSALDVLAWAVRTNLMFGTLTLFVFASMAQDGNRFSVIGDARAIALIGGMYVAIGCAIISIIGYLLAAVAKTGIDFVEFTMDRFMLIVSGTLLGNKDDLKKITDPKARVANIADQEEVQPWLAAVFGSFAVVFVPLAIIQILTVNPTVLLGAILFGVIGEQLYRFLGNSGETEDAVKGMKLQGAWRFMIVAYVLLIAAVLPMLFPGAVSKVDAFGAACESTIVGAVGFLVRLLEWVAGFFGGKVTLALASTKMVWFRLFVAGTIAYLMYPKTDDKNWRLLRKFVAVPLFVVAGHAFLIVLFIGFWSPKAEAVTVTGEYVDHTAPKPVISVEDLQVKLEWSRSAGADGYRILRRDEMSATYQAVTPLKAPLAKSQTHFIDAGVAPGRYYYQLVAVRGSGNSEPSPEQLVIVNKPKVANGQPCAANDDCLSNRCSKRTSLCVAPAKAPSAAPTSPTASGGTALAAAGCASMPAAICKWDPACKADPHCK